MRGVLRRRPWPRTRSCGAERGRDAGESTRGPGPIRRPTRRSWQPALLRRRVEAADRVRCEPVASCPSPAALSSPCSGRPPEQAREPAAPPTGHVLRQGPGHIDTQQAESRQARTPSSFRGRFRRPALLEAVRSSCARAGWRREAWPPGPGSRRRRLRCRPPVWPPLRLQRGLRRDGPAFEQAPPPSAACPERLAILPQGIALRGPPSDRLPGSVPSLRGSRARSPDRARRRPCAIPRGRG